MLNSRDMSNLFSFASFCTNLCLFIKNTQTGFNKTQFDPFIFSLVHRNYVCPNNINRSILNNNNSYSNNKGPPVELILASQE